MSSMFSLKDTVLRNKTVRTLAEKAVKEAEEAGLPIEAYLQKAQPGASHGLADEVAKEASQLARAGKIGGDVASKITENKQALGRIVDPELKSTSTPYDDSQNPNFTFRDDSKGLVPASPSRRGDVPADGVIDAEWEPRQVSGLVPVSNVRDGGSPIIVPPIGSRFVVGDDGVPKLVRETEERVRDGVIPPSLGRLQDEAKAAAPVRGGGPDRMADELEDSFARSGEISDASSGKYPRSVKAVAGLAGGGIIGAGLLSELNKEDGAKGEPAKDEEMADVPAGGGSGSSESASGSKTGGPESDSKGGKAAEPVTNPYRALVADAKKGLKTANTEAKIDKALERFSEIKDELPPEEQAQFQKSLDDIEKKKTDLAAAYREDRKTVDWLRVADTVGRALTKLGAARQGLKHNVDLSGVKVDPLDLEPNYRAAREDYSMGVSAAERAEARLQDAKKERLGNIKSRNADLRELEGQRLKVGISEETEGARDSRENLQDLEVRAAGFDAQNIMDDKNQQQALELEGLRGDNRVKAVAARAEQQKTKPLSPTQIAAIGKAMAAADASADQFRLGRVKGKMQVAEMNKLRVNLAAAGYSPEQIDGVFEGVDVKGGFGDAGQASVAAAYDRLKQQPPAAHSSLAPAAGAKKLYRHKATGKVGPLSDAAYQANRAAFEPVE
jgi:hypothetical protein